MSPSWLASLATFEHRCVLGVSLCVQRHCIIARRSLYGLDKGRGIRCIAFELLIALNLLLLLAHASLMPLRSLKEQATVATLLVHERPSSR